MTEFLQSCVLPRCFATPLDALYCGKEIPHALCAHGLLTRALAAKFIEVVVELETPFFNLPHVTDQVGCGYSCSEWYPDLRVM